MKNIKVAIFDVGGTILNNLNFSFERGFRYLYEEVLYVSDSWEDFKIFIDQITHCFSDCEKNNIEINFQSLLNYITFVYPLKTRLSFYEIEYRFARKVYEVEAIKDAALFLKFFKDKGIKTYVLSNSMFSSIEVSKELFDIELNDYFINIVSSGDHLFRKASFDIFNMYLKKFSLDGINRSEVVYLGNDFEKDIKSPLELGMNACYFIKNGNYPSLNEYKGKKYLEYSSYKDLMNWWQEND